HPAFFINQFPAFDSRIVVVGAMAFIRFLISPFYKISPVLQAAILMIIACLVLSAMAGLIRFMADTGMHTFEIVFLRNLAGLLYFLPWFFRNGLGVLKTKRIGAYCLRSFVGFFSMVSWFYAISVLPLADAVALNFTAPIRSEEHTSELQSRENLVCRLLLEKKKIIPTMR